MRIAALLFSCAFLVAIHLACQSARTRASSPRDSNAIDVGTHGPERSWESHFRGFFDRRCNNCHGVDGRDPKLHTYARVRDQIDRVMKSVEWHTMPKYDQLSDAEIERLKRWIDNGLPERDGVGRSR